MATERHRGFYRDLATGQHDTENTENDIAPPDDDLVQGFDEAKLEETLPIVIEAVGDKFSVDVVKHVLRQHAYDIDDAIDSLSSPSFDPSMLYQVRTGKSSAISSAQDRPLSPELRIDEADGMAYPRASFIEEYGDEQGALIWERSARVPPKPTSSVTSASATPTPKSPKSPRKPKSISLSRPSSISAKLDEAGSQTPSPRHAAKPQSTAAAAKRVRGKVDGEPVTATEGLPAQNLKDVVDADGKAKVSVVVVGHVDAGKSTIMGHVLHKLNLVSQRMIHKFEKESKSSGKPSFHFAWVLDETSEERERGVTMDVATTYFDTPHRHVTLLDCPGHRDFVCNMITGATQADCAILVVNAVTGEFESGFSAGGQTKEHVLLLRSVGVSTFIVAVNKMDACDFSKERFEDIQLQMKDFLKKSKISDVTFVPVSGLQGENLVDRKEERLKWYEGPTLIEAIDTLKPPSRLVEYPLRVCISDVMKSQILGTAVAGKIETGKIQVGDKVTFHPGGETAVVKGIECANTGVKEAVAGDNIEVGLGGIDLSVLYVGQVMCSGPIPPKVSQKFEAQLLSFADRPLTKAFEAVMHLNTITVGCSITRLLARTERTGEVTKHPKSIPKSASGVVEIATIKPICIELASEFKGLGRFMLRAGGTTIAAGVVKKIYPLQKE